MAKNKVKKFPILTVPVHFGISLAVGQLKQFGWFDPPPNKLMSRWVVIHAHKDFSATDEAQALAPPIIDILMDQGFEDLKTLKAMCNHFLGFAFLDQCDPVDVGSKDQPDVKATMWLWKFWHTRAIDPVISTRPSRHQAPGIWYDQTNATVAGLWNSETNYSPIKHIEKDEDHAE